MVGHPIGYMIPVEKFRSLTVELLGCAVKWSVIRRRDPLVGVAT
jgi:hypothetical protein